MFDVISAEYKGGYEIEVEFENGRRGIVDFSDYAARGGGFARFADMDYFRRFEVNRELGVLVWGNDVDIAPETLYAEATGNRYRHGCMMISVLANAALRNPPKHTRESLRALRDLCGEIPPCPSGFYSAFIIWGVQAAR